MIGLENHHGDRQKKKTVPWLSSSRSDWHVYSAVANQRQPQYTYNVLQRRCQPRPTIKYVYFRGGGGGWGKCNQSISLQQQQAFFSMVVIPFAIIHLPEKRQHTTISTRQKENANAKEKPNCTFAHTPPSKTHCKRNGAITSWHDVHSIRKQRPNDASVNDIIVITVRHCA